MFNFKKIKLVPYLASGLLLVKGFFKTKPQTYEPKISRRSIAALTVSGLISSLFMLLRYRFNRLSIKGKIVIGSGLALIGMVCLIGIIPTIVIFFKLSLKILSAIFNLFHSITAWICNNFV